ncbi:MAG TPA: hypothetical protein VMU51_21160 [Mycobacteriales bacterium]|nr:hypothetical protein [Mycobacteriales bacterium]
MRPLLLWRYEVRRAGWAAVLAPPLVAAIVVLLAVVDAADGADQRGTVIRNLFAALEMGLPLVAGIGAASLVGRDPAAELQLTVPTPYRATLLRRLAVVVGWTALVALLIAAVLLVIDGWADRPQAHGAVVGQLVWLAPTLWLAAVGFLAGAVFRGPAAAGGLVAVLWMIEQILTEAVQQHQWSRLLYLFATSQGTVPADWTGNRLTLVATAIVLGIAAWLLLGGTERLVRGEAG